MFTLESSPLRRVIDICGADDWQHDPWGTAMGLFFDIASVLNSSDIEGDVTPALFANAGPCTGRWQYSPSPHVTVPSLESLALTGEDSLADSYGEQSLAQALLDGEITQADLIYAGDILNRYTALLRLNGKDY